MPTSAAPRPRNRLLAILAPALRRARLQNQEYENLNFVRKEARWGADDEMFDLGLEKWGVDLAALKSPPKLPRRLFRCYIEDWENVMDRGAVMREKLLQKYGGLVFDDIDSESKDRMTVSKNVLKYIIRRGWHVMAEPPEYDGTNPDVLEPIAIKEDVIIHLIKNTKQPSHLNVRVVAEEDDEDEDQDGSGSGRTRTDLAVATAARKRIAIEGGDRHSMVGGKRVLEGVHRCRCSNIRLRGTKITG